MMTIVRNRKISFTGSISISIRHKNDNRPISSYRWSDKEWWLGIVAHGVVSTKTHSAVVNIVVGCLLQHGEMKQLPQLSFPCLCFATAAVHFIHLHTKRRRAQPPAHNALCFLLYKLCTLSPSSSKLRISLAFHVLNISRRSLRQKRLCQEQPCKIASSECPLNALIDILVKRLKRLFLRCFAWGLSTVPEWARFSAMCDWGSYWLTLMTLIGKVGSVSGSLTD